METEVPALGEENLYPDDVAEPEAPVEALVRPVRAVKASARATGQDPLITLALEARVSAPVADARVSQGAQLTSRIHPLRLPLVPDERDATVGNRHDCRRGSVR